MPHRGGSGEDVFAWIKAGVRSAQAGPQEPINECYSSFDYSSGSFDPLGGGQARGTIPVWPFGLVINLGLGALGVGVAVNRLSTPVQRLPRGTRIA